MKIEDFADGAPEFTPEEYFSGRTRAWGLFEDRLGRKPREFTVDIDGRVENGTLILEEDFRFRDGEVARRTWHISRTGDGQYRGTADDVVGEAIGHARGNALNWHYTLDLTTKGKTIRVDFDDWMFLLPDGMMINRARMKKFGVTLGTLTLAFQKMNAEDSGALAA